MVFFLLKDKTKIIRGLQRILGRDSDLLIVVDGHIPSNDLVMHRF